MAGTPGKAGTVTDPRRRPLRAIVPVASATRAPDPPPHQGPDSAHAVILDGPTALHLARRRQQAAREALQERPAGSALYPHPEWCSCAACVHYRRIHGAGDDAE